MKKYNFSAIIIFVFVMVFTSCSEEKNTNEGTKDTTENTVKKDTVSVDNNNNVKTDTVKTNENNTKKQSKFICANGCDEGHSETLKECPGCGMELIENVDFKKQK